MLNEDFNEPFMSTIEPSAITSYSLYRSFTNHKLYNVVARDKEGNPLFVSHADLSLDEAAQIVENLNEALKEGC